MTNIITPNLQQDSVAHLLTKKAADNFTSLEKEPLYKTLTTALFEQLAASLDWPTPEDEDNLKTAKERTGTFFQIFTPAMNANKELSACLFTDEEFDIIKMAIPSYLKYLKGIQDDCKRHLASFDAVKAKSQEISKSLAANQGVKNHFELKDAPSLKVELTEPSDHHEIGQSTMLDALHARQVALTELENKSNTLFNKLSAWLEAIEKGEKPDQYLLLDEYHNLRTEIQNVSSEEIKFTEDLLNKASFCSKAARRALDQVAELAKRYNDQIKETKERLEARYVTHFFDHALYNSFKLRRELLSPSEFVESLKPDQRFLALLKTVRWLEKLPRAELESLKRVFTNLDSTEKNVFNKLAKESSTSKEFFEKLGRFYNESMQAVEKKNQLLEEEKKELQARLNQEVEKLADLTTQKANLVKQIADLVKNQKSSNSLSKELTTKQERVLQLEAEIQALTQQVQASTQKLATTDAKLAEVHQQSQNEIQKLKQKIHALETEQSKELTASKSRISLLETEKQQLTATRSRLEHERDRASADSQRHKSELEALNGQLTAIRSRIQALEEEKAKLIAQLDQSDKQHASTLAAKSSELQSKIDALETEKQQLVTNGSRLAQEHKRATADSQRHTNELETLNVRLSNNEARIKKLEEEKAKLSAQLAQANEKLTSALAASATQSSELQNQNRVLDHNAQDLEDLRRRLTASKLKSKAYKAEKEELSKRVSEQGEKLLDIETKLKQQHAHVTNLEVEKESLETFILELKTQFEDKRSRIERELESSVIAHAEQQRQAKALSREKKSLEERILELDGESSDAKIAIARLKTQLEEKEVQDAAERIKLENRIGELLDQINTSSTERQNMLSAIETLQNELKEKRELIVNSEKEKKELIKEFQGLKNQFESDLAQAQNELKSLQKSLLENSRTADVGLQTSVDISSSRIINDPFFKDFRGEAYHSYMPKPGAMNPTLKQWLGLIPGVATLIQDY